MAKLDPGARSGAGTSSRGLSDGEDSRAYLQERLALFNALVFALSGGFFVVAHAVTTLLVPSHTLARWFGPEPERWHLFAIAVAGVAWLLCRRWQWSRRGLGVIDTLGFLAQTTAYARIGVATLAMGSEVEPYVLVLGPLNAVLPVLLATVLITIARAVMVPSRATHTFAVSALGAVPAAFAMTRITSSAPDAVAAGGQAAVVVNLMIWSVVGVVLATVISRVIYGLRAEVKSARQLGQYTLLEKVGAGGMGEVYRARHAMLRRPTAIKILPPARAGEENLRRFEREVQLLSQLTHPNTVAVYDYGRTAEGLFYYAMEYLDGVTLEDLVVHDGAQPPGRVIHVLAQVAAALAEAHAAGLIHRDVKPANVILCERGGVSDVVKVLDFGLVKEISGGADLGTSAVDTLHGTPLYMAPEALVSPERIGPRTDLYALGAVGYRLLTGRNAFEGRTVVEVLGHHLHTAPTPPSALVAAVPQDLERQILACLAKDPESRPRDADALRQSLLRCAAAGSWVESRAKAWWSERGADVRAAATRGEQRRASMTGLTTIVPAAREALAAR